LFRKRHKNGRKERSSRGKKGIRERKRKKYRMEQWWREIPKN